MVSSNSPVRGPAELDNEKLIPRRDVPAFIAKSTRGPVINPSTLHRWCLRGVRGIVLRSTMVGGRRYFRPSDITDFMRRVNAL